MGLKIGIFAFHLRICVLRSILKKLDVLFLIFLIEFFVSGSFSIEVTYWKKNFKKLIKKKKTKKKIKKKISNYVFEINCIGDLLYFHIITFSWKYIYVGVPFRKICRHAACNYWLKNENHWRLGPKFSLQSAG